MLKMTCQNCTKEISSPLLVELANIDCPHCGKTVPVNNIIISAQGYTYHRSDLIKRLFRYKSLIAEVTNERDLLEKKPGSSPLSKKSLTRFLETLEEMMAGAREHLRIDFAPSLPVAYETEGRTSTCHLINLSLEGARLETETGKPLPNKKSPISINFSLPDEQRSITLNGNVSWTKNAARSKSHHPQIGLRFGHLEQDLQAALWSFISYSTSE
jgi:hypothetical protein